MNISASLQAFQRGSSELLQSKPRETGRDRTSQSAKSRLSILTEFFPPDYAPTGQLIEELTSNLAGQGFEIEVFTGQPGYAFQSTKAPKIQVNDTVKIQRSRVTQLWPSGLKGKAINGLLFCIRAIAHLVRSSRSQSTVLLTTAPPFLPLVGYLTNLIFGTTYICLLYDIHPDIGIELGLLSETSWIVRLWQRLNCLAWCRAESIVVLSDSMKQRVIRHCPHAESKIQVIHSWADPSLIKPIPKQKNWFAWKHDLIEPFTVLYSGNMGRCHDVETIFQAVKALKDEPIKFVFIGGGAKRPAFQAKLEAQGIKNCLFLPYQDKETLPYSLTACDLSLVSVSSGMEELVAPSKLYSALSAGRPIVTICPEESYLNDMMSKSRAGASFKNLDGSSLAEFIRFLSRDKVLAKQMGDNARAYLMSNFTPELIASQYSQVVWNREESSTLVA